MPTTPSALNKARFIDSLKHLQYLRHFSDTLSQFWKPLLDALITICNADAGLICLQTGKNSPQWKTLAQGPENQAAQPLCKELAAIIPAAAQQCTETGYALFTTGTTTTIAISLIVDANVQKCLALFRISSTDPETARISIEALLSVNDLPALHRLQQSAIDALKTQSRLTDILDIMVTLNAQHRFIAAAMTVCNELASRYKCDRVTIGWMKQGYVKIIAMSHTDHFEKKMEIVEKLEMAMEEARDQSAEIVFPSPSETSAFIIRDHEIYAKAQDILYMATLPIREKEEVVALIALERNSAPFTDIDMRQLRVSIDQFSTRLIELRRSDKWFGARLTDWLRNAFGGVLGYEHTWPKLAGILSSVLLIIVALIPVPYRVSSSMILKTDDVSYLTAPFDGYIDSVGFKPGDIVTANAVLLSLDNRDLLLEQAALLAEKNREQHEIEKARAAEELAEMCISQARYDQAIAKLEINRYKLSQAIIISPYDGVIIEGDLKERRGSPVKQGEVLFKIGRLRDIYAEVKVSEAEIQNIAPAAPGQVALASRPQDLFGSRVTLIEPSAVTSENNNVFLVRCAFCDSVPSWFRPGMTGIAKINAGKKTIIWIIGHRTVDFIRLKLWW